MKCDRLALVSVMMLAIGACSKETTPPPQNVKSEKSEIKQASDSVPARFLTLADINQPVSADGDISRDADGRPFTYELLGKTAPEFTIPMHGDGDLSRSDLAGKWSVVDFWGLWCADCIIDAPYASALRTALDSDPDVQFISIHTPSNPTRIERAFGKWGSLDAYFADTGTSFPVAIDTDAALGEAFKLGWVPTYLLIAPDLKIHAFRTDLHLDDKDGIKPVIRQISELRAGYIPVVETPDELDGGTPQPETRIEPGTITESGVAGLTGPTPFSLASAQRAFSGYDIRPSESMSEGVAYPLFEVLKNGEVHLELHPDASENWIGSVVALSPEMTGPLGETPTTSLLGDFSDDELGECIVGVDELANSLLCWTSDDYRFGRVFKTPETYSGLLDQISGDARDVSLLTRIIYRPDLPAE